MGVPLGPGVCASAPRTHTHLPDTHTHPWTHKPPGHPRTHPHSKQAGGTHPTGMLSCSDIKLTDRQNAPGLWQFV